MAHCLLRAARTHSKLRPMRDDHPPFLDSLLDELKAGGPYLSKNHAHRAAERLAHAYNARPQAELGGLSPNQMRELLDSKQSSEWISGTIRSAIASFARSWPSAGWMNAWYRRRIASSPRRSIA